MKNRVYIYHTNDIHSHFENWPKVTQFLNERRAYHQQRNEQMLLFDIGDFLDRFHPITEATKGKANIQLLNDLGYDAVTIGNNEGITLSFTDLNELYEEARFPVIVANLFNQNGERPTWLKPYHIIQLTDALKIGVIGLTVHYSKFYELLGWSVTDPFSALKDLLHELSPQVDIIVLLSHLGINEDERIAEMFEEVDIILGAHTHHVLPEGRAVKNTLICGAGKFGEHIGIVKLEIDGSIRHIQKSAHVAHLTQYKECEDMKEKINTLYAQSEKLLNEKVIDLYDDLKLDWFSPSPFAKLMAAALKEWCEGEIGMVNAGVLLEPLFKGTVTKGDLHRICPHPINPCKVYLRGDELKEVILQANTEELKHLQIKGLGFRGKLMGQMVYDGLELETETLADGLEHIHSIIINGEELDTNRVYAVATIDMFTFGNLYPEIRRAENKQYYLPEFLRNVLEWKLKKMYAN